MRTFPRKLTVGAGIAALLLASACSNDDDSGPAGDGVDEVVYLTSFGLFGRDAYAVCAVEEGIFADYNFDVEVQPGGGTDDNLALLLSGQADFIVSDLVGAVLAIGDGVEGFHTVAAIQQNNLSAWMTNDPDIQSPRDLEGRTVGLSLGAVTGMLFPTYAELAGIDLDEVTMENVAPQDLSTSLAAGQVDAIGQFAVGQPLIEMATDDAIGVFPYSDYVTDLYGIGLNVATSTIEESPEMVERFRDALLEGLEWSLDNPEQCGEHLVNFEDSANAAVAAQELELMVPYVRVGDTAVGSLDRQRVAQMIATLEAAQAIPPGVTPEDLVDFDMLP